MLLTLPTSFIRLVKDEPLFKEVLPERAWNLPSLRICGRPKNRHQRKKSEIKLEISDIVFSVWVSLDKSTA